MTRKTKSVVRARSSAHVSLLFLLLLLVPAPCSPHEEENVVSTTTIHGSFLRCVSRLSPATADPSGLVHAPSSASYPPLLNATIQNLRFASPKTTPHPALLLTPSTVAEVQACVACCRLHNLTVRARSGGHDYEGLSYRSVVTAVTAGTRPFAVLDVALLREVRVDPARRVARVGPGATLGELYYAVARDGGGGGAALGFPAGICPTVCVGGHLSGGGFGPMMRKHGLAADNVVDAEVVDADGRFLPGRAAMGEGLFWAIRGGGGGSFGVVVSWTVRLVPVPRVVSVFTVRRRGDRRQTRKTVRLLAKWQRVAHALPEDLFVKAAMESELDGDGERYPLVTFKALYLGGDCSSGMVDEMSARLPELGVTASDCRDVSWVQSMLYFYGYTTNTSTSAEEVLLDRSLQPKEYYKVKLDYVTAPIPAAALAGLLDRVVAQNGGGSVDVDPQGGAMSKTPESATPYAHRRGYLYNVQYFVRWGRGDEEEEDKHLAWVRGVHGFMTPFASARPRAAYVNFRDLDLGKNVEGETKRKSYEKAAGGWGQMYFGGNFRRLAMVKAQVDPEEVFWSEQSIPPLLQVDVDVGEEKKTGLLLSDS